MKKIYASYTIALVLLATFIFKTTEHLDIDIYCIYSKSMRHYLFTSFLTIGSFILSLMTMIVFTMHKNLFENEKYIEKCKIQNEIFATQKNIYTPLVNIGNLFLFSVLACFITSTLQFSIGLSESRIAAAVCISAAATNIMLVLYILYCVKRTMNIWFSLLLDTPKV